MRFVDLSCFSLTELWAHFKADKAWLERYKEDVEIFVKKKQENPQYRREDWRLALFTISIILLIQFALVVWVFGASLAGANAFYSGDFASIFVETGCTGKLPLKESLNKFLQLSFWQLKEFWL